MKEEAKIQPALTPEEWALVLQMAEDFRDHGVEQPAVEVAERMFGTRPHPNAALALHGQPFAFTWEDVDALRFVLDSADFWDEGPRGQGWPSAEMSASTARLRDLADRIAALLPPR